MVKLFNAFSTGAQEPTPTGSKATAFATLQLSDAGDSLSYSITTFGLDFGPLFGLAAPQTPDTADDVISMHFHAGQPGANGPVVFGIYSPLQDADDRKATINADGTATVTGIWEQTDPASQPLSSFLLGLRNTAPGTDTGLYLNIHTNAFKAGEIRGQVAASFANLIQGTDSDDNLIGGVGDDTLFCKGGNDVAFGSNGNELLNGNQGNDTLYGEGGNDNLRGGKDNDAILGGMGEDVIFGDIGDDILYGNQGNDVIEGNLGQDSLYGGQGNDFLLGRNDNDFLSGDKGNDDLSGVNSKAGRGRGEIDTLVGGEGVDNFYLGKTGEFYYEDEKDGDPGLGDYGLIVDFKVGEDLIAARGTGANYVLGNSPTGLPSGTAIYVKTSGGDELIGIVQGVTTLNFDKDFLYKPF